MTPTGFRSDARSAADTLSDDPSPSACVRPTFIGIHGNIDPKSPISPETEGVSFLLTNKDGTVKVFELKIPAGDLKRIGRNLLRHRRALAQNHPQWLTKFSLRYFLQRKLYTFEIKAYGDLSLATDAKMIAQLAIGDDAFSNEST